MQIGRSGVYRQTNTRIFGVFKYAVLNCVGILSFDYKRNLRTHR